MLPRLARPSSPPSAPPRFSEPEARTIPPRAGGLREEILLYDLNDSPFCLKIRICLNVKGVPFRRVALTVRRLRDVRRLNPFGKVPVLVQDGTAIADSSRIARHLESAYPEPALIPIGAEARAYAALLEEWADEALYFLVGAFKWLNPVNRPAALANTATEMTGVLLRPLVGRAIQRNVARRYAAWGYTARALADLEERMAENLATLSTLLEGKAYLLGRVPTLADVAVFAQLAWMQRYAEKRLLAGAPVVGDWLRRFAELPPVAAALAS